jgi:hypothetical protein
LNTSFDDFVYSVLG